MVTDNNDSNALDSQSVSVTDIFTAGAWGALSAVSLILGAIIGIVHPPSEKWTAALMAFGAGALIEALAIELFGHILHEAEVRKEKSLVTIAIFSAIVGGVIFAELDKFLNSRGAFYRKVATTTGYVEKLRRGFN